MDCSKSVYESRKWLYARVLRISILLLWLMCVCSCVFASENVDISTISGIGIRPDNGSIVSSPSDKIAYFEIEPGYVYTITRSSGTFKMVFSNVAPAIDVDTYDFTITDTITFSYSDYRYVYCDFSTYYDNVYTITREPLLGQKGAIDKIIFYVLNDLWPTFGQLATVISFTVVFALGYYLLKYYLQRISKGKG